MISSVKSQENGFDSRLENIFKRDVKVKYKVKLSGKVKLYVSDKNAIKGLSGVLSLYKREFH